MVGAALNLGLTAVDVKEIHYQAVQYVGIVPAFDFIHTSNEVLLERGISLLLEGHSRSPPRKPAMKAD